MEQPKDIFAESVFNNTAKNGKPYLVVQDGQQKYGVWEAALFPLIIKGQKLSCIIESKGNYTNIVKIFQDGQPKTPPAPVGSPQLLEKLFDKVNALGMQLDRIEANLEGLEVEPMETEKIPY